MKVILSYKVKGIGPCTLQKRDSCGGGSQDGKSNPDYEPWMRPRRLTAPRPRPKRLQPVTGPEQQGLLAGRQAALLHPRQCQEELNEELEYDDKVLDNYGFQYK